MYTSQGFFRFIKHISTSRSARAEQKNNTFPLVCAISELQGVLQGVHSTNMSRTVVTSESAPPAIGPYSQAISAGGMLYVSGCLGLAKGSDEKFAMVDGVEAQTRQVLQNMQTVVEAGGSEMAQVVKCTVLLTDMADFPTVNKVYSEFFPASPPARMCYAVKSLPLGGLVEIDAIAVVIQ